MLLSGCNGKFIFLYKRKKLSINNPSAQEFRLITKQILVDSQTTHNREVNCKEKIDFYFLILLIYQK